MKSYRDWDNDSNVSAYEIGSDYIIVKFKDNSVYKYTYRSAGSTHIEKMKKLARQGDGLNAYINNHNVQYISKQ